MKVRFTVKQEKQRVPANGTVVGFQPGKALVRTHAGNLFAVDSRRNGTRLPEDSK